MTTTIDMSKFKRLLTNIEKLGFDDMYQAGSPSAYHEINLILKDYKRDLQIWVCKSFGKFYVNYRNGVDNVNAKQHRFHCRTQKQIIEVIHDIRDKYAQAPQVVSSTPTYELSLGDVVITGNGTYRIAARENQANKFITLAQANMMLQQNLIQSVSVELDGDEVFMTIDEAIAYKLEG